MADGLSNAWKKVYNQVSKERYEILMGKYQVYVETLNDPDKEPVQVFEPLSKKLIEELELIREVSRELQQKKEDDVKKAAAAAASQAEEEAKRIEEEKKAQEEAPVEEPEKKE